MPAFDAPILRGDDADDANASSDEVRMRQALERLGTRSLPPVRNRPGAAAGAAYAAPQRRHKFAREGEVPVERVPPPLRSVTDLQRELTEERAARQRAEQVLAEAQARVSTLQAGLSQAEQAARAAREAVEEREAAMAGLRAELKRTAARLEAALADKPADRARGRGRLANTAQAKLKQAQELSAAAGPQPVRWWLPLLQPRR